MSGHDWDTELTQAFEILLRQPLAEFDARATFALYHWDDVMSSEFFDDDLDLGLLARGEVIRAPFDGVPVLAEMAMDGSLSWKDWQVDLGRSMFLVEDDVTKLHRPRPGTEVGRILATKSMSPGDLAGEYACVEARIHTDGSLFEAMRAATWTLGGPENLVTFDPDNLGLTVEPKWERRLAVIGNTGLRDHLRMLCLDAHSARADGARYVGAEHPGFDWMRKQGYRIVAAWELGEGQATSVVVQHPHDVA